MFITDLPYFENLSEDSVSVEGGFLDVSASVTLDVNLPISLPTSYSVLQSASALTGLGNATANALNTAGDVGNSISVTIG
jgi:hypothetical protein